MDEKLIKEIKNRVGYIWINRPDKKNALDLDIWFGLPKAIKEFNETEEVNCIVIAGKGDSFSSGIDITTFMTNFEINEDLTSNTKERRKLMNSIKKMQDAFTEFSRRSEEHTV